MATPEEFARQYGPLAIKVGADLQVNPDILLGQWGLETGWGRAVIPGTNNLGNIKDFSGSGVQATDNMTGSRDAYRAYGTPQDFGSDFASLIARRYSGAMGAGADAAKYASALKAGGYAEDPDYVRKLTGAAATARRAMGIRSDSEPNAGMVAMYKQGTVRPASMAMDDEWASLREQFGQAPKAAEAPKDEWAALREQFAQAPVPASEATAAKPAVAPAPVAQKDAPGVVESIGAGLGKGLGTVALNAQRFAGKGLGAISSEGTPGARAADWLVQDATRGLANLAQQNAPYREANPITNSVAELGGNIVGTAPVGGLLGRAVGALAPSVAGTRAAPVVEGLSNAMRTGGFRVGPLAGTAAALPARVAGGAATGGASAALVDPQTAGLGAAIGGALPVTAQLAGAAGRGIRNAVTGGGVSPEVAALAQRARELGINVPADRLVNSKPLNAISSALNYVPFSGRAATEAGMESQLNRALSRTFGQDSDNVTMALRKASSDLGAKFDDVLKNNAVAVDDALLNQMAEISESAGRELGKDGMKAIEGQIGEMLSKGSSGVIDGQAAYNIKRTLDRIGSRSTPEAFHARELKKALMGALDRSLGPEQAASFARTRQQYGNMLSLENLAQNGAEGGVSVARLANMKGINNRELQEIADIAAQFVRPREGQHGAMQRAVAALGVGGSLGLPALAGVSAAGRGTNALLNSNVIRDILLNPALPSTAEKPLGLLPNFVRSAAPLIPSR
ncbi:glucosaminidase domain-containing protein [Cupriavidus gilardii]|uniref:Glucosaminidase domain-containing protein n=1 Tax=Cupriavidus gilardii TaxID=82541 RepID=A0ABY4VUH5_9BURK|nr:glucosaminidase domain-containing protein [Cupriavidus gilardii]USE79476.1 glucosaminidase domain-containing protein [Cupriavidus gilardii]